MRYLTVTLEKDAIEHGQKKEEIEIQKKLVNYGRNR